MYTRFLTYDKKNDNDYTRVYKVLEELKAKQITESTYEIKTSLSQDEFVKKIKPVGRIKKRPVKLTGLF